MDNLAHKMVDTFEKMDAINPTFEQIHEKNEFDRLMARDNLI
jgi:hypothetical protein